MTLSNKSPSVQTYRLLLFQRALHPELFNIQDRRSDTHADYELESWVSAGGHVLRFQVANKCLSEAVVDQDQQLPQRGILHTLPCLGEKEMDDTIDDQVRYVTSVQTELLSENLYTATFVEMRDFARDAGAMWHEWGEEEGTQNLSILDVQRYKREVHAQAYHLISAAGFVLRTQSIFEIAR
ncbi:MAG: hypothetical protein WD294_08125 [Phycisphaeraceae bacterium]